MNKEIQNNNFIIASRAYFLHVQHKVVVEDKEAIVAPLPAPEPGSLPAPCVRLAPLPGARLTAAPEPGSSPPRSQARRPAPSHTAPTAHRRRAHLAGAPSPAVLAPPCPDVATLPVFFKNRSVYFFQSARFIFLNRSVYFYFGLVS